MTKPEQITVDQQTLEAQSAFGAAYSWQREQTARNALIANAGPRCERPTA